MGREKTEKWKKIEGILNFCKSMMGNCTNNFREQMTTIRFFLLARAAQAVPLLRRCNLAVECCNGYRRTGLKG